MFCNSDAISQRFHSCETEAMCRRLFRQRAFIMHVADILAIKTAMHGILALGRMIEGYYGYAKCAGYWGGVWMLRTADAYPRLPPGLARRLTSNHDHSLVRKHQIMHQRQFSILGYTANECGRAV